VARYIRADWLGQTGLAPQVRIACLTQSRMQNEETGLWICT
jgi:hypothetical protein